ncbi:hypothetical protein GF420_07295 [candidate division GN15 bacterium]|nr:hypothetical protein [candidate division GN15 bacterium]
MANKQPSDYTTASLPSLPLEEWEDSKITLHLYLQIIGKIRLALMPPLNHWWHVPLYLTSRGLTTRPIPYGDFVFEISLDFIGHTLLLTTSRGGQQEIALRGQPVADFYAELTAALDRNGIAVDISPQPFDHPSTIPFPEDTQHKAYDPDYIHRYWTVLLFGHTVLTEFAGRFVGKCTPIHLFWHSFDLAYTRFSGREAPALTEAGQVAREAYSHEVISFGFWAGDDKLREPAFYSYTYPEPPDLRAQPISPDFAYWVEQNGGSLAILPYRQLREADSPRVVLLNFLESAYQAGARQAGWDIEQLTLKR